ncbi:hypothetical protein PLESTB_001201500 [Pleodorina starrii]|uniref:Rotatin n=1 Tax=Pleodorina starrii TaxID=330485 RepID=A0A9W6BS54_9CHLO|nr:hypothetical protein PLESTB_001201500 [Pleodorina starrii]
MASQEKQGFLLATTEKLGCLQYPDNGSPSDVALLMLLAQAAAAAPGVARQLLHLGAEPLLAQLQQSREGEVQVAAGHAFAAILGMAAPRMAGSVPPTPASLMPMSTMGTPVAVAAVASSAGSWAHQQHHHHHHAPGSQPGASPLRITSAAPAASTGARTVPIPVGGPRAGYQPLSAHAPSPSFTYSPPRGAEPRRWGSPGEARQPHAAAASTSTSSTAAAASSPRDWLLQPVSLGQADDQELFELSLRLKCATDPRVVVPALMQLHGSALVDLPVEAVAARHGIVEHLLALLSAGESPPELVALAARCLLRMLVLIKRAMLLATDPMYTSAAHPTAAAGAAASASAAAGEKAPAVRVAAWASPPRSPGRAGYAADSAAASDFMSRHHQAGRTAAGAGAGADVAAEERHAQRLLPLPLPPPVAADGGCGGGGGGGAGRADEPPINVTRLAHAMAPQVFHALRDPQRLFALAPLVEELLPLLLLGRDGAPPPPGGALGEQDRAQWAQLLQILSRALVANLSMARAESPPIVQAFARDGAAGPLPPVLNAPAAALLALAARLLASLPRELWTPELVPPALADAAAAVACDEVLSALLPSARRALAAPLAALRPDVAAALDAAAAGEAALAAGEAAARQLPALRAGELPPGAWLAALRAALPALHLPGQEPLLESMLQGLALVCGSGGSAAEDGRGGGSGGSGSGVGEGREAAWVEEAEGVFLGLLSHSSPAVAMACYGLLEGLLGAGGGGGGGGGVQGPPGGARRPLLRLLSRPAVLERLVVLGLWDERTRRQVARILMALLPDPAVQACIQPWSLWVRLYAADPQLGALAASLEAAAEQQHNNRETLPLPLHLEPHHHHHHPHRPRQSADPPGLCSPSARGPGGKARNKSTNSGGAVEEAEEEAEEVWGRLRGPLLALFSGEEERRRVAAVRVAEGLQAAVGGAVGSQQEPYAADPFRLVLDGGARDDLVVPSANPRLARSFRPADVSNLLSILGNGELAMELRRSAAEQMLALAGEERLRDVMEEEASLRTITCVAALCDPATGAPSFPPSLSASQTSDTLFSDQAHTQAQRRLAPPTPDLLSTLDVQLPLAAVNLLFVLAARSPHVRAWLVSASPSASPSSPNSGSTQALRRRRGAAPRSTDDGDGDGDGDGVDGGGRGGGGGGGGGVGMLVRGVVPLVFHPMVTVRRAVARLLAALGFGAEADRWSGWRELLAEADSSLVSEPAPALRGPWGQQQQQQPSGGRHAGSGGGGATVSAGDVLALPYPFQRCYSFPCRVTWVRLPPACQSAEAEPEALEGKPRLQDLVAEQRQLVVLLIQERRALQAAGGDLTRLMALMNERPDCLGGLPPAALHTLAASVRSVAPGGLVTRSLAAVRAATCHSECTAALRQLQTATSSRQGAAALAAADWQVHFESLLSAGPISPEDRALWVELLEPIRRAIASGAVSQVQLQHLAQYFSRSALEVLSAPDAAVEPPSLPLGLAGSSAHHQLMCTHTVLATLVDLVRCARTRLAVPQALRVLAALSPCQLLRCLAVSYVDNVAASYGCRAAAVQLMLELTTLMAASRSAAAGDAAVAAAAGEVLPPHDAALQGALRVCLEALLGNMGCFAAGAGAAAGLRLAAGPGPGGGAAAVLGCGADRHGAGGGGGGGHGFGGKGAQRMALHCLLHLTSLLPAREWTAAWQQLSGSFWVSRLLRDRDAVLRALAAEVLARLLQPGASATQAMVAQGWPDALRMMLKAATDPANCYALRTAALRVLCCCMAQDSAQEAAAAPPSGPLGAQAHKGAQEHADDEDEDGEEEGLRSALPRSQPGSSLPRRQLVFASLTALPPAAFLLQQHQPQQQEALWAAALPRALRDPAAPPPLTAAALALLLQCALLDGERAASVLQQPGMLARLLKLLEPPQRGGGGEGGGAATAAAAAAPAAAAAALAASGGGDGDRAAVLLVLSGLDQVGAGAQQGGGGLVEGDAGGSGGGGGGGFTSAAQGWAWASAAALGSYEADVQLEACAGLEAGVRAGTEWPAGGGPSPAASLAAAAAAAAARDPARPRHHLAALRCTALVAQLLTHCLQQEPPLLSLPPLPLGRGAGAATAATAGASGASVAGVAAALLGAFGNLVTGVAAWDEARGGGGGASAAQLAEGAARLEAARHTAAAANAALQLLDGGELHEAVVPLDSSLVRSCGCSLLGCCAEVLLAGCSPRPLRLAVVCLMATLLSRRETAARLLRSGSTDSEHLVGSTGREVGAGLCAALIDLMPDNALLPLPATGAAAAAAAVAAGGLTGDEDGRRRGSIHFRASTASGIGGGGYTHHRQHHHHNHQQQPTAPGGGAGGELRSDGLAIIVALRNLLSYSDGAKAAALRAGFHRVLMQGCARAAAAAALAGAAAAAAAEGTPKRAGGGGRGAGRGGVGARRGPPVAGGRGLPPSQQQQQPQPQQRRPAGPPPTAAAAAAAKAPAPWLQQQVDFVIAEVDVGGGVGGVEEAADAGEPPEPLPTASPTPRGSARGGGPGQATAAPAGGGGGAERKDAEQQIRAAARRAAEQKLVASLSLLRHLAYGSVPARQQLVRDGIIAALRALWPTASATSATAGASGGGGGTSGPLFHELLCCLTNLIPGCAAARAAFAQEAGGGGAPPAAAGGVGAAGGGAAAAASAAAGQAGGPGTLLGLLLSVLFGPRLEASTFMLAAGVLQQLAAAEDGAALLLRSPFLGLCQKALQELANGTAGGSGGGGGGGGGGHRLTGRDPPRQMVLLELLTSLAAWPEGQRALLRSSSGPGLLELVVRLMSGPGGADGHEPQPQPQPMRGPGPATRGSPKGRDAQQQQVQVQVQQHMAGLRNAALALVRNLCFAPEARAHLLAHPAVLPALVAAAEAVAENPRGAAYAASGMWALAYHGEKVKAAIRRVPSAPQRLVAAYASSRFEEDRARAQQHRVAALERSCLGAGKGESPGGASAALLEGRAKLLVLEEGESQKKPNWVGLASSQLSGLLTALQATMSAADAWQGNLLPPDWSPQRDQYA